MRRSPGASVTRMSFTTLEHVACPREVLAQCHKLLRPGGFLISVVPNHRYWWAWLWPKYIVRRLRGMPVVTHSVRKSMVIGALEDLGLELLHYTVYGFRPPQKYFGRIREGGLDRVIARFRRIGDDWRHTFLQRLLYLEMYIAAKAPRTEAKVSFQEAGRRHMPSLGGMAVGVCYYGRVWGSVMASLLAGLLRKAGRYLRLGRHRSA